MNCPKCGMEAMISASHNTVTGDASPETPSLSCICNFYSN